MKIMKRILMLLAVFTQLLTACNKNDGASMPPATPYLQVANNTISLPPVSGTVSSIDVTANVDWKVTISPAGADWLQVDKTTGTGNGSIQVKVIKDNVNNASQTATVQVSSVNNTPILQAQVTIEQKAYNVQVLTQKLLGGTGIDIVNGMAAIPGGGYILAGYTFSTGNDIHSNNGQSDFWVVKLNNNHDTVWTKCLGGMSWEYAESVAITADGGCVVTGSAYSTGGYVHNNHGANDYWVVKLNSNGDTVWTKALGGTGSDLAHAIIATSDGGFLVAGESNSNNGDVTGAHGNSDGWVVKLDFAGNKLWQKTIGGAGNDVFNSIEDVGNGAYILAGYTESSSTGDVGISRGGRDAWVVKLNEGTRNIIWSKNFGGSGTETLTSVKLTTDDNYIVAGNSNSNNSGDVSTSHGVEDFWILKLNAGGDTAWTKLMGGSGTDRIFDLVITSDGGCVLAGYTGSNDGDVSGNHGSGDGWLVKLGTGGRKLWSKVIGGSADDQLFSLVKLPDGSIVTAGFAASSNSGDINITSHGSYDDWLVKLKDQ
jgi:hypothetical protein